MTAVGAQFAPGAFPPRMGQAVLHPRSWTMSPSSGWGPSGAAPGSGPGVAGGRLGGERRNVTVPMVPGQRK